MQKQKSSGGKPVNENENEETGQRGEVTKQGGSKIHGDDSEGTIGDTDLTGNRFPAKPSPGSHPAEEDIDNDDRGELK